MLHKYTIMILHTDTCINIYHNESDHSMKWWSWSGEGGVVEVEWWRWSGGGYQNTKTIL